MGGKNEEENSTKIGLWTIWAIGVGSALGGDFFGWQFVLWGGFGSAFFAVLYSGVFYWLYASAITELAARYRTSGGSFDFVKAAMGKKYAALMAVLGLLKLILANAGLALSISSYLISADIPSNYQYLCWLITYGVFTFLDCIGVRQSANIQVGATVLCVIILLIYSFSCFSKFNIQDIKQGGLSHDGALGFFKGLPFALQFFDGFEEVPLLMGYAIDPERTIPKSILLCFITVTVLAFLVLVSGSGVSPSDVLLNSEAPLMDGLDIVYGTNNAFSDILAYVIVIGLVINFFAFVIFTSQQVCAIAEAGQLPQQLAYRHPIHGAPVTSSIFSSCVGVLITSSFVLIFGEAAAQNILVTAALMPAVLGYMVLLQCIVEIRSIEAAHNPGQFTNRQLTQLGHEPGKLRFFYGAFGAKVAQWMCGLLAFALCVLASVSNDFMIGLIIVGVLGIIGYYGMTYSISDDSDAEGHLHQLLNADEVDDSSTNPFNAAYSMTDDDGNDMELVFQPVHHEGDEIAL